MLLSHVDVDGGGQIGGHAVPAHDVALAGGLGGVPVAGPVRQLLLLLSAGLEPLALLLACSAWHSLLLFMGLS